MVTAHDTCLRKLHRQKPAEMQICATVLQLLHIHAVMHHSDNHKVSSKTVLQVQLHAEHFGRGSHQSFFDSFVCTLVHQTFHVGGHCGVCPGQHIFDGRLFRPVSPHRGKLLCHLKACLSTCHLALHVSVRCHPAFQSTPTCYVSVCHLSVCVCGISPACGFVSVCLPFV